ncbi:MAG TPA: Ldh family oxidoreductase [Kiritimatiellia bacterium]|nr:Ldh family oxidoreductase [Kiritimatiellia bacterium]
MGANNKTVDHSALRDLCVAIQQGYGVSRVDATAVADCLVEANLMGLDTHGVIRLKFYMDRVKAGGNNPAPDMRIVRENACTALLDADNAMGPVGGKRAMELAIDKAEAAGVGVVLVRHCNHYGPAGHYVRMALERGMVGISLSNVLGSMPPTGGAQALIGNNPYAIGFPSGEECPVVVDGATSKSSWGKLFLCAQTGEDLPAECYTDKNGLPTLSPAAVMDGGALLPFAGHKGYGIAVAIELLTGMLADAALDHDIQHPYKNLGTPGENSFFMLALRVDNFCDAASFRRRVDEWIRLIRGSRRASGVERIWLPGQKEHEIRAERLRNGIPLNDNMLEELSGLADGAGVSFTL